MIKVYIVVLVIYFYFVVSANIESRYVKNPKHKKTITSKFALSLFIVPPKKTIYIMPFINYIIQLCLFVTLLILYTIDWITKTTFFVNCPWIYLVYSLITAISEALSEVHNRSH